MLRLRALTLAPTLHERAGRLDARGSLLIRVLTLGAFARRVLVDRQTGYVVIEQRRFWVTRRRVIPFRHVHRIDYEFRRTVTSLQSRWRGDVVSGDDIEHFRVALIVRAREDVPESHAHLHEERVPLFDFHGEGLGLAWLLVDFEGQQEALSRHYVARLSELIGVRVGLGTPQLADKVGRRWACSVCKRPGPPRPGRCYYCGGELTIERERG